MKYSSILSIAAVAMIWPVAAIAAPPQLKGTYGVTGTANCAISVAGFTAPPTQYAPEGICNYPIGNAWHGLTLRQINATLAPNAQMSDCPGLSTSSFSVEGIRHFNGDGTGTAAITSVTFSQPPGSNGVWASSETATFSFTYAVDNSGGFTSNLVAGSYNGTYSGGLRDGQTLSRPYADMPMTGLISNDGKTLTLASVTPTVETLVFSGGNPLPGIPSTYQRICHRSRVLIWQGN
jgi:hypothetical protein